MVYHMSIIRDDIQWLWQQKLWKAIKVYLLAKLTSSFILKNSKIIDNYTTIHCKEHTTWKQTMEE